ncbi:DUF7507 domain-containing protein, partial [Algoriphagus boseongensis]
AGSFTNTATASTTYNNTPVRDTDSETVNAVQTPDIDVEKVVITNDDTLNGQISYEITVSNTGNVTLNDIYVEDIQAGLIDLIAELAPGAEEVYTVSVTITQQMIDEKCFTNTAVAEIREYTESQSPNQGEPIADYIVILSDEDQVEACFTQSPELQIEKTITAGDPYSLIDDLIEYEYVVTNSGNVTLNGPFTVNDDKIGVIADPANTTILSPGATIVFTAVYSVTEADLLEGSVTNIATGIGFFGESEIESQPDNATAESRFNEILAVDDIAGTFDYATTPQTSLVNALTNDELKGGSANPSNVILTTVIPDPSGVLSVDANGEITIAANPQAGDYQLTYRITEIGNPLNFDEAVITVTINPLLGLIEVEEYCELDAPYLRWIISPVNFNIQDLAPGDDTPLTMTWYDKDGNPIIVYENIPLEGYMLFPGADTIPGGYGSAWPGWKFENNQWVSGNFNFYQVREDGAYVVFKLNPEIQTEVTYPGATEACNPDPNAPIAVDDDMTSIPVSTQFGYNNIVNVLDNDSLLDGTTPLNTSLVTVTEVGQSTPGALLLDTATGLVSVSPGLAPGIYTLEYRICTNPNPTNCDTAIVTVLVVQPSVQIEKSVVSNDDKLGGFITYEIKVTNDGDVELQNVEVKDDLTGDIWMIQSLAPQEFTTFTAELEITQNLIEEGCITNTATATVYLGEQSESEQTVLTDDSDSAEVCLTQTPDIAIEKDADVTSVDAAGDVINYTLTITNTGNLILNSVTVNDPLTKYSNVIGQMVPGQVLVIQTSYTVTQGDMDNGSIINVASVTGFAKETQVSDQDDAKVNAIQNPAISIEKTSDVSEVNNAGDVIKYTLTVTNTGNVTLNSVKISDPLTGYDNLYGSMVPGQVIKVETSYTVTQSDVDSGSILNVATAEGFNGNEKVSDQDDAVVKATQSPAISIEKTSDVSEVNNAGDVIKYTLTVTNTGNVTLSSVKISDPLTGYDNLYGSMVPGQVIKVETSYTVTQSDVDSGSILNVATAEAFNGNEKVSDQDDAVVKATQSPAISIEKTSDVSEVNNAGDVIKYTLTVTNTGNVTLNSVKISDPLTGYDNLYGSMVPGQVIKVETSYTVTQSDIDSGSILNVATAEGFNGNEKVSDQDDAVVTAVQNPDIDIEITDNEPVLEKPGDEIPYTIVVTNTGNVTLDNVTVVDTKTGTVVNVGTLAPGESKTIEATYPITQEDVDTGSVKNEATATGESPNEGDNNPTATDEVTTPIAYLPGIQLVKTADKEIVREAGEVITYTLTVTNTGNVTLAGVVVKDPLTGLNQNLGTIAPGQVINVTTNYTVTTSDLEKATLVNIAQVLVKGPRDGEDISDEAEEVVGVGANEIIANDDDFGTYF